jgi:hypothetical protein
MIVSRRDDHTLTQGDRSEVSVGMEMIVLVAIVIWSAVVFVVISICRAAKWSDEAMEAAIARPMTDSPAPDQALRTLDLSHAAALLGVSPDTLLAWEARYGFPTSSASDHRFNRSDVLALRDSILDGVSIAAAVARARQRRKRSPRATCSGAADHRDGGLAS